jgi:hypothetical protein
MRATSGDWESVFRGLKTDPIAHILGCEKAGTSTDGTSKHRQTAPDGIFVPYTLTSQQIRQIPLAYALADGYAAPCARRFPRPGPGDSGTRSSWLR